MNLAHLVLFNFFHGATPSDAPPPILIDDTHDGFDEDRKKKDSEFRGKRERLREVLTQAWDGTGEVATEVKALAAPFVDILESGALRIDYAAMEKRNAEVMAEILAFQDSLRAEYQAREDDEKDVEFLILWS